jgi:hypothetical protein
LAFESRDVVRSAVLTPDGASVVYHAVGRSDRADRGIWRVEPGAAGSGRQVLPAVRADDSLVAAVGQVWTTRLEVADAGQRLAVESCGAEACRIRIANLERSADADAVLYAGELVGLDDERLLTLRDCDGLACDLVATDVATGLDRRLAANVASAATVALESRLFAVAALQDRGRPVLGVIDAADARTWLARNSIVPDQGSDPWGDIRLLSRGGMPDAGIEAPPGWTAMVTSRGSIVTVDVARIVAGGDAGTDR